MRSHHLHAAHVPEDMEIKTGHTNKAHFGEKKQKQNIILHEDSNGKKCQKSGEREQDQGLLTETKD